jgi:hypothetical protein
MINSFSLPLRFFTVALCLLFGCSNNLKAENTEFMNAKKKLLASAHDPFEKLKIYQALLDSCDISHNLLYARPMYRYADSMALQATQAQKVKFLVAKAHALEFIAVSFKLGDSSFVCLKAAAQIYQQLHQPRYTASRWVSIAENYGYKGKLFLRLDALQKGFAAMKAMNFYPGLSRFSMQMAFLYADVGDKKQAVFYMNQAQKYESLLGDTLRLARNQYIMGMFYARLGLFDDAFRSLKASTQRSRREKNKEQVATNDIGMASFFIQQKKYQEGEAFLLNIMKGQNPYDEYYWNARQLLSEIYVQTGRVSKAIPMHQEVLEFGRRGDNDVNMLVGSVCLGKDYAAQHNWKMVKKYALESERLMQLSGIRYEELSVRRMHASADSALGNFKEAYFQNLLVQQIADSLGDAEVKKKGQFEAFRNELSKQKLADELKSKEEINKQKRTRNTFMAAFGGMVLVSLGALRSYRRKKRDHLLIQAQKAVVEQKKEEILDSIEYAKRIQTAILPPPRIVKEVLRDSFILYLPKDIVAGDFYWMESKDNEVFFAACDCTGHGVPGALVSMLCNSALNRAFHEFGERLPGRIFDKARELVLESFAKSEVDVYDGMDGSLAVFNPETRSLSWAGANNPLWVYRASTKSIEEIRPDKQAIGKGYEIKPFTTHNITLSKGDAVYLFTDGFADQFGGVKGKKLTRTVFREKILQMAERTMDEQRDGLLHLFDEYKGGLNQVDDVCVIGIRV